MPEDVKAKIFDPFFTTKPSGIGTGLGLSVSFGIVQDHRGQIRVESAPGEGTEFIITLPTMEDAPLVLQQLDQAIDSPAQHPA
jgi:signal transduction histidine kinase